MSRRIYPRPPIVEAVIDVRFARTVTKAELVEALERRLGEQYQGERKRQDLLEVSAAVEAESVATSARRVSHMTFLRSADGLRLLGCGDGVLSVHVLAPYPGWESFLDQAREAIDALPEEVRTKGLTTIAVRYVDRIVLPSTEVAFNDYLKVMPTRPEGMPLQLSGFHVAMQIIDPNDSTVVTLAVASAPPNADGRPAVIYDLNVQRSGTPLCGLHDATWVIFTEELHQRQREIFEGSITDMARELFQ